MPILGDITHLSYTTSFNFLNVVQSYSKKDWSRWDSFEPKFAAYCPQENSSLNTDLLQQFQTNFKTSFAQDFMLMGYNFFVGMLRNSSKSVEPIALFSTNSKDFFVYCCMAVNFAYNKYRQELLSWNQNIDNVDTIDWVNLPTMKQTILYFEAYVLKILSYQTFDHQILSSVRGNFDIYGCFKLQNNYQDADPNMTFWYAAYVFSIFSHFMHLFSVSTIRQIRKSSFACFTALTSWLDATGTSWQLSTAQWITRITGASVICSCIIQSEKLLKSKNSWTSDDNILQTDKTKGIWLVQDALNYTVGLLNNFVSWTQQYGIMEYCSVYYGFTFEQLSLAIVHAPNKQIHDLFQYIYYIHLYDILNNLMLSSSSLSAPTNRSYSLLLNQNSQVDSLDIKLFVNTLFTNTNLVLVYNSQTICNKYCGSDGCSLNFSRYIHMARIAANLGFNPLSIVKKLFLDQPNKISIAKFTSSIYQDRYNFITPYYQVGNSGPDAWHSPDTVMFTVRLPGQPNQNKQSFSTLPFIRFYCTNFNSQMFKIPPGSVMMTNNLFNMRQVWSQFQAYSLITHLIDFPKNNYSLNDPISTTLLVPLNINGSISCNGVGLPVSLNTSLMLPANCLITVIQNQTICGIKILSSQFDSNVNACPPQISQNTDISVLSNDSVNQPCHIMYQIDNDSFANGCAKIILTHKNPQTQPSSIAPFRQAFFVGCGRFTDGPSAQSLFYNLNNIVFTQTLVDFPANSPFYKNGGKNGKLWTCQAQFANNLFLKVVRGDFTSSNQRDFKDGIGSTFEPNWVMCNVERKVNNVDCMQALQNLNAQNFAMKHANINFLDVYEPHLNKNQIVKLDQPFNQFDDLQSFINNNL